MPPSPRARARVSAQTRVVGVTAATLAVGGTVAVMAPATAEPGTFFDRVATFAA